MTAAIVHETGPLGRCCLVRPQALRAFSLIEILVVVAILALLMAILIPSLLASRRQVWQTRCKTNLKQIADGWNTYLLVSKDRFPRSSKPKDHIEVNYGGKQGSLGEYKVPKLLNPFIGLQKREAKAEQFNCPFDRGSSLNQPSLYDCFGSSYLMNYLFVGLSPVKFEMNGAGSTCRQIEQEVGDRAAKLVASQLGDGLPLLLVGDYGWYNAWHFRFDAETLIDWHDRPMHYNLAFLHGGVEYVKIRRGISVDKAYVVVPFNDLAQKIAACKCEQEVLPP